jgi:membrane protein DedA with SNARE-associated domain
MNLELSNVSKFSIWVAVCVSIGLTAAAVDGATVAGIIRTALAACVLMVVGLLIVALLRSRKNSCSTGRRE